MQKLVLYHKLIPWLVLFAGIAITYLLQKAASDNLTRAYQTNFDHEVRATIDHIEHRLQSNAQILIGVKSLFVASDAVSRQEFRDYIRQLDLPPNYPGIKSIRFAPLIPLKELPKHIKAIRAEGFTDYKVFPEGERETYAPLVYVEPFADSNLRVFGFDAFSNPVRRAAMIKSRDSGKAVISGKVSLVHHNDQKDQTGFIMYLPIYRNGSDYTTQAGRHANIIGWVNAAFQMSDLMRKILSNLKADNIEFQIFDGEQAAPESLMYQSVGKDFPLPNKPDTFTFQTTRLLPILGHAWTIKLSSHFITSKSDQEKITIISLSGALLSGLLSLIVWQLINARKQSFALANRMTEKLRKSEIMTRAALNQTQQQWYTIDQHTILTTMNTEGKFTYANDKFCQLSGYQIDEIIGQDYQLLNAEPHPDQSLKDLFANSNTGSVWHGEVCSRAKDGNLFWLLTTVVPFLDEGGIPRSYAAVHADITPLKQAEHELKESLSDKEALLKEVYHRVKNNLQVVSSLMNLQLYTVKNKDMIDMLKESINRIKSMALIHENLYQTANLARINFHDYAQNLISHLLHVYGVPDNQIKIEMDVDALAMDADMAIPCGLIINELISNALKYAFPETRQGVIVITFKVHQDEYFLMIADNGVGFPEGFDIHASKTLGLQLVSSLSTQLQGTMTLDKTNGTSIMIRFRPMVT